MGCHVQVTLVWGGGGGAFRQHWLGSHSGNIGGVSCSSNIVGGHSGSIGGGPIQATWGGGAFRQHWWRGCSGNIGGGPMHVTLVGRGLVLLTGGSSLLGEDGGLCSPWRHIIHST